MKQCFLLWLLVTTMQQAAAQGGPPVWRFGEAAGVVFTPGSPLPAAAAPATHFRSDAGCATVTDKNGNLIFTANEYHVYDRNDNRLATFTGSSANNFSPMVAYTGGNAIQSALIVPFPHDTNLYYVFSLSSLGQLFYSVADRSLNNGLGDIVPGKKGRTITSGLAEKLTAVKGCNNIWVIVRSMTANRYLAYSITDTGLNLTPVVSDVGMLSTDKYRCGVIKFAPDGRKMAAASFNYNYAAGLPYPLYGGLELYDFDPFSGKLHNPLLLDSTRAYYGACFSGDGLKLYASATTEKQIYQWDLSQPNTSALLASQTMVLANPNYWVYSIICGCWIISIPELGDLQRGPDGKIYIGNNISNQQIQTGTNSYSGNSNFLHVIHQPNQAGVLCQPQANAVNLAGRQSRMGLPNDIVYFPKQDTLDGIRFITACFRDSMLVTADTGKEYLWTDGSTDKVRMIKQAGNYTVRYTGIDCALHFDTFIVRFPKLPIAGASGFSCPGANSGRLSVKQAAGDTTRYAYSWKDADGNVIRTALSNSGDMIAGLDTGRYFLQLTTASGCDTTLPFYVQALPVPDVSFDADSIACIDQQLSFRSTGEGIAWQWTFGDGDSSDGQQPVHIYRQTGFYPVTLTAMNAEGCSNTMSKEVEVKDFTISLSASEDPVKKNALVWLTTNAAEPYEVLAWRPAELFPEQEKKQQEVKASDSRYYTVIAQSEYGCSDSATLPVRVLPVIFMPTVFSPNGDGKNDLFHPVVSGEPVKVRYFQVYDRWGKMVWKAGSNDPAEGWDGTYAGTPAETGAYFYFINIETATGETFQQKGDVTVVR